MSSTAQATSSTSAIQTIIDALADYTKVTGIDVSKNSFAAAIERSDSPEAILELLQEREKTFKEYRDNNRRLINCLTPAVKVIHAFSGILGNALTLVSHKYDLVTFLSRLCQAPFPPARALFVGIDVLLAVRPSNTLFIHFLSYV
jgi:fungal STAND N-terminal Goodbye domain